MPPLSPFLGSSVAPAPSPAASSRTGEHAIGSAEGTPAFEELYRAHFAFVWRTLRSRGICEASLDDAVQEVFLVVHRKGHEFEGRSAVRTWLYAICNKVASNIRRTAHRKPLVDAPQETLLSHGPTPIENAQRAQAAQFVETFLADLEEAKRSVFQLCVLEGMSAPEVAEITGMNVNSVYSRLRTVKEDFRRAIQEKRSTP